MTLEKIIKTYTNSKDIFWIILKKKNINFKSLLKKKKYIEVCEYWYDDENNPEFNTWIDVEGIGYGWMWCANKIRSKFEFLQRRAIKKYARNILKTINDEDIAVFKDEKIFIYGFFHKNNPDVYIQIRLSDEELHFM